MKRDALVYLISGTFFGLLVGWILGSQQGGLVGPSSPSSAAAAPTSAAAPGQPPPPPLDVQRAGALEKTAASQPSNVAVRVELGNLYYDAERFELATSWYEAALKLNPRDSDVSTDLAICYFYTDQADRALAQIDRSLGIDPKSTKAFLNQGIFRAYGKQDLAGAAESWQKVIALAPTSDEAARATRALEGIKANHPGISGGRGGAPDSPPSPSDFG